MTVETLNEALRKIEQDNEPNASSNCPICGCAIALHLGMVWHNGAYVGDAWECDECATHYCCMNRELGE